MSSIDRELIYVAGPYSAPTHAERESNAMRAIDAGIHCLSKGHYPFIPHLTHFVEQRAQEIGVGIAYEDYLEWDEQFLDKCDSFLYLEPSAGADQEFEVARELGLTIYFDCNEIRKANNTPDEDSYQ